jgi:hypothetical protein
MAPEKGDVELGVAFGGQAEAEGTEPDRPERDRAGFGTPEPSCRRPKQNEAQLT